MTSRALATLLALACVPLGACAADTVLTFGPALHVPAAALAPLVDRSRGLELRSCADLIAALHAGTDLGELAESPRFKAYADCMAAALVAEGRGASAAGFGLGHAGDHIYRDLDLASVASSLAPQRPSQHYRLRDFKFDSVRIEPLSVALSGNGFSYTFQVLAFGDFRHLGAPELLVRFTDRATTGGTYDTQSVLVLHAAPSSSALQATDAIDVLKQASTARRPAASVRAARQVMRRPF